MISTTTPTAMPSEQWTLRGKDFEFRCCQRVPPEGDRPPTDPSTWYGEGELELPSATGSELFQMAEFEVQRFIPLVTARVIPTKLESLGSGRCLLRFTTAGAFQRVA